MQPARGRHARAGHGPPASAQDGIRTRITEASRAFAPAGNPVGPLDEHQRERVVDFVLGNALFTLSHELGHAAVGEFNLPVLGREEDAVDAFATLALLHIGTDFTHGVLVDAARGLVLIAEHDARMRMEPAFYGEHGLNRQRAYKIVCLMFGSDPATFGDLARQANLPQERPETCQDDFDQTKTSWLRLLAPHLRASSRPSFWERLALPHAPRSGTSQSSANPAWKAGAGAGFRRQEPNDRGQDLRRAERLLGSRGAPCRPFFASAIRGAGKPC